MISVTEADTDSTLLEKYRMDDKAHAVSNTLELSAQGGGGGCAEASSGGGSGAVNVTIANDPAPAVLVKRKRGRPKKTPLEAQRSPNSAHPTLKRGRGRPKGSGRARLFPLSPPPEEGMSGCGADLAPHILPIYPGEDVHGRILSFAQYGNRAITVLSCNGPVARISICSPGSTGGMIYEGLFEILTLNGTFTCVGTDGSYHRRGMLTASLGMPNGEVFGGCVSGPIIAAGPIQLILCSFNHTRRPPDTQVQNYLLPHLPETRSPPSSVPGQATVPNAACDQFTEAGQNNIVSSLNSDSVCTDAPVAEEPKDEQPSAPFLIVSADRPQAELKGQAINNTPFEIIASSIPDQ